MQKGTKIIAIIAIIALITSSVGLIKMFADTDKEIATVSNQVITINDTIPELEAVSTELKGYIENLEQTATKLQGDLADTNTAIDTLETEVYGKVDAEKTATLNKLKADKTELKEEITEKITQINVQITALKEEDTALDNKIAALKIYVDNELKDMTDWANATFCTLEQYQGIQTEIATIKARIDTINTTIEELETDTNTKIAEINTIIGQLETNLKAEIKSTSDNITNAYTSAIATAKTDITAAYTTAIQKAISSSETLMKEWVNKTLADGYYTTAEIDGKLKALQNKDAELETVIETAKQELTTAYTTAIQTAIDEHNGKITQRIATDIATAKSELQTQIDEIKQRLNKLEENVKDLLSQVQSVTYIPKYDDGKAKVVTDGNSKYAFFDFMVSPSSAFADVNTETLKDYLTMQAVYTGRAETRGDITPSTEFADMDILELAYDKNTGVLTVKASGDGLSEDFYNASIYASAVLKIKTDATEITSGYIPLVAHSTVWVHVVTVQEWINVNLNGGIAEEN